jgi:2-dehydropantoate 2-reductase
VARRHAILGAGGVGGLIGAAMARLGCEVTLLLRPETFARHPGRLRVESVVLGDFEVEVATAKELDREVDVLWMTPKAPQLEAALSLAPPDRVGDAVVVPLLNGIDHVELLRQRYARVVAAAIRVEAERVEPGLVRQKTPFARVDIAPGDDRIAAELQEAGFQVVVAPDEATVLWEKIALLAPLALTTTAADATGGVVQTDPEWRERLLGCHEEAADIGAAEGATLDPPALRELLLGMPLGGFRTSMQKDFDAGRPLELDAIGGAIVRAGERHGIPTPATEELIRLVEARPRA